MGYHKREMMGVIRDEILWLIGISAVLWCYWAQVYSSDEGPNKKRQQQSWI